jgi:hypothetical protein
MTETPTDFADIPGMPLVKWDGWDSTVPLPTRRIQLPIQMQISRRVGFAWPLLIFCIFAAALFVVRAFHRSERLFQRADLPRQTQRLQPRELRFFRFCLFGGSVVRIDRHHARR